MLMLILRKSSETMLPRKTTQTLLLPQYTIGEILSMEKILSPLEQENYFPKTDDIFSTSDRFKKNEEVYKACFKNNDLGDTIKSPKRKQIHQIAPIWVLDCGQCGFTSLYEALLQDHKRAQCQGLTKINLKLCKTPKPLEIGSMNT